MPPQGLKQARRLNAASRGSLLTAIGRVRSPGSEVMGTWKVLSSAYTNRRLSAHATLRPSSSQPLEQIQLKITITY